MCQPLHPLGRWAGRAAYSHLTRARRTLLGGPTPPRLQPRGVIQGYELCLDPRKLGLGVTAFIFIKAQDKQGEIDTGERLTQHPNVLEVHHIAGEDCFLVKLCVHDTDELGRRLRSDFSTLPSVSSTRTIIVLGTLKESARIPIPGDIKSAAIA